MPSKGKYYVRFLCYVIKFNLKSHLANEAMKQLKKYEPKVTFELSLYPAKEVRETKKLIFQRNMFMSTPNLLV